MTKEQAIEVLKQVAILAQSKGVLNLENAKAVIIAMETLDKKEEVKKK